MSFRVLVLLTLLAASGPLATDLYLPSLPILRTDLNADVLYIQLTLTSFLLVFALAQILYGPFSDRFGRRPAMISGIFLFFLGTIICTFASSIYILIFGRIVQALGACAGPVIIRAMVRDSYPPDRSRAVLGSIASAMAVAPIIGPVIGGFLTHEFGWQACFAFLTVLTGSMLIWGYGQLPETNQNRTSQLGLRLFVRNFADMLRNRIYIGYLICGASIYTGLFAFISGSSFVFVELLHLSPFQFGFCFAAAVVGFMIGAQAAARLPWSNPKTAGVGAAICFVSGVAQLGFLQSGILSVPSLLGPMIIYMIGFGLAAPSCQAGALEDYPERAGAASALFGLFYYGVAAIAGLYIGHSYQDSAFPMVALIAASGTISVIGWLRFLSRP